MANVNSNSNHVPKERVFVTVPRIKPGNPASIAEIVPGDRSNSVLLAPYPNWKANTVSEDTINCDDTIVSVFRTKVSVQYQLNYKNYEINPNTFRLTISVDFGSLMSAH